MLLGPPNIYQHLLKIRINSRYDVQSYDCKISEKVTQRNKKIYGKTAQEEEK